MGDSAGDAVTHMARGRGRAGRQGPATRRTDTTGVAFAARDEQAIIELVDDLPDAPEGDEEGYVSPEDTGPAAPAALPERIDGLTHYQVFLRAQQVIADLDARRAQRMGEATDAADLWEQRIGAAGILDRTTQRLLVAAARLDDSVANNPMEIARLRERARETLVATNTRLLYQQARGLAKVAQNESHESRFQALVALGEEAILETVDKYEFDRPEQSNFLTYASWWVRQAMQRYTYNNSNAAKVPEHRQVLAMRVRRTIEQLRQMAEGQDPSFEQVVDQLNAGGGKPVERESVKDAMELLRTNRPQSLNQLVRGGSDGQASELGHLIQDTRDFDPLAEVAQEQLAASVDAALEELDDRQRRIIISRYGLGDQDAMDAVEIQQQLGISKGAYDGSKERGERALAFRLALEHRPELLAKAMGEMDQRAAQALRLFHGLDHDGRTTRRAHDIETVARWLEVPVKEAISIVDRARKDAVQIMTHAPASRSRRAA